MDLTVAKTDYPVNGRGLTYGSDAAAGEGHLGPDLVAVVGDEGVCGFVYARELDGPRFSTPEEALRWQAAQLRDGPPTIDVYDNEGTIVVDKFTLDLGVVTYD